ncbi:enoyl-CoA hydratase/isomerase family protein [Streptomyces sp. NPDC005531]|uniref:enoyl-CoA hydratase/isomerase family protein n=1 Tax=Streptomyces sp. NPDC005531 TaxID=3364722 RepID=UPI003696F1BB
MSTTLSDYATRFTSVALERRDGILLVRLHTDEGPLVWGEAPHRELPELFRAIGDDPENRVLILTGTGQEFMTRIDRESWGPEREGADIRDAMMRRGKALLDALMALPTPVIGVVNGPARYHAELPLLSDVVLAAETTVFQDTAHFHTGGVPGDGVNILWPLWLGVNRGRHFLLSGREISAPEALDLGLVAEVLPLEQLMERAWEIAYELIRRPRLTLRYTRAALTLELRRHLDSALDAGLALQFLARAYPPGKMYPWVDHD